MIGEVGLKEPTLRFCKIVFVSEKGEFIEEKLFKGYSWKEIFRKAKEYAVQHLSKVWWLCTKKQWEEAQKYIGA